MRQALIVLLALVLGVAGSALAGPSQDFEQARDYFRKKDCGSAVRLLTAILHPSERIADREQIFEARAMLGACFVEDSRRDDAKAEFERALQLKPRETLDPLFYSDPARRLFDDTKADIENRARKDEELRQLQKQREELEARIKSLRVYREQRFWLNFAPFGLGQLQNDQPLKAALFGGGQLATLGVSAGIWYYLVNKYGLRSDRVLFDDAASVRRLQAIEVGTGIAFIGLYAWSVIDAIRHHEPQRRVEVDDELLKKTIEEQKRSTKKTSLWKRMRITPMLTPSGAGIGIGWEN